MIKDFLKITISFIILLVVYYVLDIYFDDMVIIFVILLITIPIALYSIIMKGSYEYKLEVLCDADSYLEAVKKKYANKEEYIYNTYLAYAYLYQGNFSEADKAIKKVDKDMVQQKSKHNIIYYMVLLKLAYNEQDLIKFNTIYQEFQDIELEKNAMIDFRVFEIPKYLMEERYMEIVELLIELIPRQQKRYLIIELEYYLAIAYIKLENYSDARAVLEFVANKNYQLFYVEKCRELLETLPEDN